MKKKEKQLTAMENNDFQLSNGINNNNRKFFAAATFEGL